jgi:hypothetical protein
MMTVMKIKVLNLSKIIIPFAFSAVSQDSSAVLNHTKTLDLKYTKGTHPL